MAVLKHSPAIKTSFCEGEGTLWDREGGGGETPAEPLTSIFHMVTTPADRRLVQFRNLAGAACASRGAANLERRWKSCCPVVAPRIAK
jgi:hypothetical protein